MQFLVNTPPEQVLHDLVLLKEEELIQTHFGLSLHLRNGLLLGNCALRDDTGRRHPDEVSSFVVRALWKRLKGTERSLASQYRW